MRKLNEALRAAKRQATPFARGKRKQHRRKPGRKAGHPGASQATPDHVDDDHAQAHAVIASVAQTAHRQGATITSFVTRWLRPDARASAAARN